MQSSSAELEATLVPDKRLQVFLLACSVILFAAGVALIATLPISLAWRVMLLFAWSLDVVIGYRRVRAGMAGIESLHVGSDGSIRARAARARPQNMTLSTGSVVLARFAWLRLRFPDRSQAFLLLRGDPAKDIEWQRFQLIWRHSGAAFGRAPLS